MPLPDVSHLRNYGVAFSDAEGAWPLDVKLRMRRQARAVVMGHLSVVQKLRFFWAFLAARRRAADLDQSDLRARGMTNGDFLHQQLEYLAMFVALDRVLGTDETIELMKRAMDASAREPLVMALPEADGLRDTGDAFAAWRAFLQVAPDAAAAAGCHRLLLVEDSDDLVFPEFFEALGIRYRRTGTLARGADRCDLRFERIGERGQVGVPPGGCP